MMFEKKETGILTVALIMTLGFIGVCIWGLSQIQGSSKLSSSSSQNSPPDSKPQDPTLAQVSDVPSGLFTYGGSTAWAPIRPVVDAAIKKVRPEFRLRYTQHLTKLPSSTTGIEMLFNDQLTFSQSSRPLKDKEYQLAEKKGFVLKQVLVAIDAIAVVINPQLNIQGLTIAQLRDIYLGKITNWNQVGGPDLEIIPYSRTADDGTVDFLIENILNDEKLGANVEIINTTTIAIKKLADNVGGIYFASAPEVIAQCSVKPIPIGINFERLVPPYQEPLVPSKDCPSKRNQLNKAVFESGEYPITRPLFVIVKENGQIAQKAGEAYVNLLLTKQGQDLVEEAGFTRIRY